MRPLTFLLRLPPSSNQEKNALTKNYFSSTFPVSEKRHQKSSSAETHQETKSG
ncbi:hypothetical protein AVEN_118498-1, partial [Araneus ventricosus]